MSDTDQGLDLAEASGVELAEFAQRHGVALERLERCQDYLRASAPIRGKFRLLALIGEPHDAVPALVLRLVRNDGAWVELPAGFPIMVCSRCCGPMKLVEIANERDAIARVLATVGLGPRPPPRPSPSLPGQLELKFAA